MVASRSQDGRAWTRLTETKIWGTRVGGLRKRRPLTDRIPLDSPNSLDATKRSALARLKARRRPSTTSTSSGSGETLHDPGRTTTSADASASAVSAEGESTCAAVDGLAVIFFNPNSLAPFLVFASEGLAGLVDRDASELLGRDPSVLFADHHSTEQLLEMQRTLIPEDDAGRESSGVDNHGISNLALEMFGAEPRVEPKPPVDIDLSDGVSPARNSYEAQHLAQREFVTVQTLQRSATESLLVHATYSVVPSMSPSVPYVLVQFRDLSKQSAEQLVASETSVVGSLGRGQELGLLCHQVCSHIEDDLADGSSAWLALANQSGELEPIVRGGFGFKTVAQTLTAILESSSEPTMRVVSFEGLPAPLARTLRPHGTKAVWFVPIVDSKHRMLGALGVVTKRTQLDQEAADKLSHYASVTAAAIERASAEGDAAHQSLHDPLTHLPNRALIVDRLGQATARLDRDGIALSVLLVDIDHFKSINDTWGVDVGDRVLLEVADRLLSAVRLGDTVGRISSDQYLVLCVADRGELHADAVAHRILTSLAQPFEVGPTGELRVTASVGVVVVDEVGSTPAAIIGQAESALAKATSTGRGRFVTYKAGLNREVLEKHATEQALHQALVNNELVVHYQPIVEVRNGFMVGAEALIRWERPGFGLLYPGSFIEVAEQSDLIVEIGRWVIDKVCEDLGSWPKSHGRSPMVSVNLAARQLSIDTLVPSIVSALRRNGLHPNRLGFEITESMGITDLQAADRSLTKLSELGCRIAIDDFGIGHATLDYLRRFSMADVLKIDRSFVAGLNSSREDTAIVHASIALASSLGLQVIAEGVENVDQLADLQDLGCRYAQGFGLGKPVGIQRALQTWAQGRVFRPEQLGLGVPGASR